jgi:hypothetical protein
LAEASQARRQARTARTQDNEHTLAAPHSINGLSDGGALVAGHNEIYGQPLHRIAPETFNRGPCRGLYTIVIEGRETIERSG